MKRIHLSQADVDAFPEGAIWNAFIQLLSFAEANELSPEQLPAYRAYWYDSEVLNGGHLQYFLNRGVAEAHFAVDDLHGLGYQDHSKLLARAVAAWQSSEAPGPESVDEYVERALEGDFDQFDELHACIQPGILDRLEEHLKQHHQYYVVVE